MAFRNKAHEILHYYPDILIVPECEHPDKLGQMFPQADQTLWFGENHNKGLAIFSFNGCTLEVKESYNDQLKLIVPLKVSKNALELNLFAIWANHPEDRDGRYIQQIWKALDHYDVELCNQRTLLIGDFNSNAIWDKQHKVGSHSNVVSKLAQKGIHSTYHFHHKEEQGSEQHPTFYFYKHIDKPFHIDYCFASEELLAKLTSFEIGEHQIWSKYSDHMPLIATFEGF